MCKQKEHFRATFFAFKWMSMKSKKYIIFRVPATALYEIHDRPQTMGLREN